MGKLTAAREADVCVGTQGYLISLIASSQKARRLFGPSACCDSSVIPDYPKAHGDCSASNDYLGYKVQAQSERRIVLSAL